MSIWATTKAKTVNAIEQLVLRLEKRSALGYTDKQIITDGLNEAIQDLCLDRGIPHWRFLTSDCSASTTSGTAYVDLTANIFNILTGTVRIEAQSHTLRETTLDAIYQSDPGRAGQGLPMYYALDASSDPEAIRLFLYPIPDAAYTIAFEAETIPDEDGISSFPSWVHSCLRDKATENALRRLGHFEEARDFAASYERRKLDNKESQGLDGPTYVRRTNSAIQRRNMEDRCPSG